MPDGAEATAAVFNTTVCWTSGNICFVGGKLNILCCSYIHSHSYRPTYIEIFYYMLFNLCEMFLHCFSGRKKGVWVPCACAIIDCCARTEHEFKRARGQTPKFCVFHRHDTPLPRYPRATIWRPWEIRQVERQALGVDKHRIYARCA